jgi:hypothetical protein
MFNQTPQAIIPKNKPQDPCPLGIGEFQEEQLDLPLEDESNES